jgi:flagellin-specific chaperone FliS
MNKSKAVLDLKQKLEGKNIDCAIYDYQIRLVTHMPLEQQPNELETIIANMQGHLLKLAKPQAVTQGPR